MKPKFVINYPIYKVEKHEQEKNFGDKMLTTFYVNLKTALEELGYRYEFVRVHKNELHSITGDIYFSYHTRRQRKNTWHIKGGPLRDFWHIDTHGYAGWSEMATSERLFKKSQRVDLDQARDFFDTFSKNYIQCNASNCPQPQTNEPKTKGPYIFFPSQVKNDSVVKKFSKIDPVAHIDEVIKHLTNKGYSVVFKPHPGPKLANTKRKPIMPTSLKNVIQFSGSIHDAISGAKGVVVLNSGVGFESLLHLKHVFVSGVCDYHWVAHKIYSIKDIQRIPKILETPVNEERIIKFVYYMLNEVYVDANDCNSIKKKLERIARAYKK